MIVKKDKRWLVMDSKGKKVLGTHDSKEKAAKQLAAIEISKKERLKENEFLSFKSFLEEKLQSTLEYHQELNPKLWNGSELKPEVREKLIEIGTKWAEWAKIPQQAIQDMILVGGNANFNYTSKSDIDLHILIDVDKIPNCPDFIDDYLKDKKTLWSMTHDITIYGQDVEVYAQDMNDGFAQDQGVYTLTDDHWLSQPVHKEINLQDPYVEQKVMDYIDQIDALINSNAEVSAFEKLKRKFKEMRSESIKQGGEFSQGNLIFKELRNLGYLDRMNSYLKSKIDQNLSL